MVVIIVPNDDLDIALRIAGGVLDGEVDIISGCRKILAYRSMIPGVSVEAWDVITAIASETDDIPVRDVRDIWDARALAMKDADGAGRTIHSSSSARLT